MRFGKIWGKQNPADLFTKHLDEATSLTHTKMLRFNFTDGRANAPTLNHLSQSLHEVTSGGNYRDWKWLQVIVSGRKGLKQAEAKKTEASSSSPKAQEDDGIVLNEDMKFLTREASQESSIACVNTDAKAI